MPENEDYDFTPPDMSGIDQEPSLFPPSAEAAYVLQLIRLKLDTTSLPDDIKKNLIMDMLPYINNASMTKITRGQVKEFYGGYKELWIRYRIFKVKKKYVPELNYVMAYIRELLIMNLNKSVEGWQGDHVFEKKSSYDIKQTRQDISEKVKNIFGKRGGKKVSRQIVEEETQ